MALNPEQVYKLGAEALGWNNTTAAGKASIAEDMKLLKRLKLANAKDAAGSPTHYQTLGQATAIAAALPDDWARKFSLRPSLDISALSFSTNFES